MELLESSGPVQKAKPLNIKKEIIKYLRHLSLTVD